MALIEALPTPQVIQTTFGTITLTHRAIGFTSMPWQRPRITSVEVRGALDAQGNFEPYPGTEKNANWRPADIQAVGADGFTADEIVTRHDLIVART